MQDSWSDLDKEQLVICCLGITTQYMIFSYMQLGMKDKVECLKQLDAQLLFLFKSHPEKFTIVHRVRKGSTLLVGEGNLSFAYSLATMAEINAINLTATILESVTELSTATVLNAKALRQLGAIVLYDVDATKLRSIFGGQLFDTIIFQFPHVGSRDLIGEDNPNFILVRDFLISAASQLLYGGLVLISAVASPYYEGMFQFEKAAYIAGFQPPKMYPFDPSTFPGYEHTMTHKEGSALEQHKEFGTWVFQLRE